MSDDTTAVGGKGDDEHVPVGPRPRNVSLWRWRWPVVPLTLAVVGIGGLTVTVGAVSSNNNAPRNANVVAVATPSEPTTSSVSEDGFVSPSPSPTAPELSPSSVVAVMPAAMRGKYQDRIDSGRDGVDAEKTTQYFYYANTLEELPVHICLALAANSAPDLYNDLPPDAVTVEDRLRQWVAANPTTHVEVDSNNTISDSQDYIDFLAMDDDQLVNLSLTHLCPEMTTAWKQRRPEIRELADANAAQDAEDQYNENHPMVKFDDGRYTVGRHPGMIQPGTYRIPGPLQDCYWERSTGSGHIIANNFINNAPRGVTVTLHAGEGFTSKDCASNGRWTRTG